MARPERNYRTLHGVLKRAYDQAATGKGRERHGGGKPFEEQPMQTISELIESPEGMRYQAIKKIRESARLEHDAQIAELLGAINYIAGLIVYLERHE